MSGPMLDADLTEVARHLNVTCLLRASDEPARYRTALGGRQELAAFFDRELGWSLEVHEVAGVVRLHKRRDDVPSDRGPHVLRKDRRGDLARAEVLVLVALVCEQLWRRPRLSLNELMQSVAQVCAAEAPTGRLPPFRIVATDGVRKRDAHAARQNMLDALTLLVQDREITVDGDLDHALTHEESDLYITADRDSLSTKLAALSPTLLGLSARPVHEHAAALTARALPEADPQISADRRADVDGRRLASMRRVVDDPGADPHNDTGPIGYLTTPAGRERALTVAASLGLVATVRRDWWELTDPSGVASSLEFPQGRRTERQAALALLSELPHRAEPDTDLTLSEITALFTNVREQLPRWAAAYSGRLGALAQSAAAELVAAGLLAATDQLDTWRPTPGIHLWRVHVRHGEPARTARSDAGDGTPTSDSTEPLRFTDPESAAEEDL